MNRLNQHHFSSDITKSVRTSFASEIGVEQTKELIDSETDLMLIDCRGAKEHRAASIAGSVSIPIEELADRVVELESYRDKHIVVFCHHGGRSLQVVNWLRNHGFEKVQNLTGGIDAWARMIDPSIPRY